MKEQKNSNMGMKVLSVSIAIFIWLLVANTNDPVVTKRFTDIPVDIINEEALTDLGYAYEVTEGDEVTITVKGKNSIVGTLSISDFRAVADFSKLSEVDAVPIDVTVKKYTDQLEIMLGTVNTMKIKKDEMISVSVPVNIVINGDAAEGYAPGKITGTPNLVRVTGPANLLDNAKAIIVEVDIDGIDHDVTTNVKPILYDADNKKIDSKQIAFDTPSISISIELWKTKKVQVSVEQEGEPADGYQLTSFDYEPKEIIVAAPDDILADLTTISLPAVSLDGLTENYEKDIDITEELLPDNVVLADDVTDIKIKANIEKVMTRRITFEKENIQIKGKQNKKVTFHADNQYVIAVEGPSSVLRDLKITDFAPWIDVSGMDEGEHEITVHVKEPEGITVNSVPEISITVK
ncbi:MAG: CdaR family protein [Eubacterium sp.]|nr:CdaR family protein [Eubacterium sp.]